MSDQPNDVSRPHVSNGHPQRHVDIGTPPDKIYQDVQNDVGATAINGAQYDQYKDHPHGH
jgi:hypothetical protein